MASWQAAGWDLNSQHADPGFTNLYQLMPISVNAAVVDAGHPTASTAVNLTNTPRDANPDAGAYEWGSVQILYTYLPAILNQ